MKNEIDYRTELAGQAMASLIARATVLLPEVIVKKAYDFADALIEEGNARAIARDQAYIEAAEQDDLDTPTEPS